MSDITTPTTDRPFGQPQEGPTTYHADIYKRAHQVGMLHGGERLPEALVTA